MWVLLLLSLIGFVIFVERTLFLHRGQIRSMDFVDGIKNLLRKRRLIEALTVCEETPGPLANIVKAASLNYEKPEAQLRGAIQEAAVLEIPLLERRVGTIAVIARISPLVGLFGTVVAAIQILYQLNAEGAYATSADYAGLLGRALISPATGIAIGIMAQVSYNFLWGRVRALVHDIEFVGQHLLQFLLQEIPRETGEDSAKPNPTTRA